MNGLTITSAMTGTSFTWTFNGDPRSDLGSVKSLDLADADTNSWRRCQPITCEPPRRSPRPVGLADLLDEVPV